MGAGVRGLTGWGSLPHVGVIYAVAQKEPKESKYVRMNAFLTWHSPYVRVRIESLKLSI